MLGKMSEEGLQPPLEHMEQKHEKYPANHILPNIGSPDPPVSLRHSSTVDFVYSIQVNYILCRYARAELFYNFNVQNIPVFPELPMHKIKKVRVTLLYQKLKLFCSTL